MNKMEVYILTAESSDYDYYSHHIVNVFSSPEQSVDYMKEHYSTTKYQLVTDEMRKERGDIEDTDDWFGTGFQSARRSMDMVEYQLFRWKVI
jgi:hypothetical protein